MKEIYYNRKEWLLRVCTVLLYVLLCSYLSGFSIKNMFDPRGIAAVVLGMALFTLPQLHTYLVQKGKKKGCESQLTEEDARFQTVQLLNLLAYNGLMSGFLTSTLFVLARFSGAQQVQTVSFQSGLGMDLRAILYGLCIYAIFHVREVRENVSDAEMAVRVGPSKDELYLFFQKSGLTNRETELAILAYQGYSNREIAQECYISEATVKKHMTHIFEKLDIAGREDLKSRIPF